MNKYNLNIQLASSSSLSSSTSLSTSTSRIIKPFIANVESINVYQQQHHQQQNDNVDSIYPSILGIVIPNELLLLLHQQHNDYHNDYNYNPPIIIDEDIHDSIDTIKYNNNNNHDDDDDVNNDNDDNNNNQNVKSILLSNIISNIHPALTVLEPYGLLLNSCNNNNDNNNSNIMYDDQLYQERKNSFHMILLQTHENTTTTTNSNTTNSHNNERLIRIIEEVNGESMIGSPTSVIQVLPIYKVLFLGNNDDDDDDERSNNSSNNNQQSGIPLCPVCRFRIEPQRVLGLGGSGGGRSGSNGGDTRNSDTRNSDNVVMNIALPKPSQRCSNTITSTKTNYNINNSSSSSNNVHANDSCCKNMEYLSPWDDPSYCKACHVLQQRLTMSGAKPFLRTKTTTASTTSSTTTTTSITASATSTTSNHSKLYCDKCEMKETLWVCLSCGIIGCGRYSLGHAEQHYNDSLHPFSLELATQRIWDYNTSSFVNRVDLLNCIFMQRILGAVNRAAYQQGTSPLCCNDSSDIGDGHSFETHSSSNDNNVYWWVGDDCTTPKKAAVVGEEYEALLQSALEDQAQHFDLEIAHLQAQLASEAMDMRKMSPDQITEVEGLEKDISELRTQVEALSREYVNIQSQEAAHRAKSNILLREQSVTKQLLDKIREETTRHHVEGKQVIEELEQQISDLTANLEMKKKFADNHELSNAHIYGTSDNNSKNNMKSSKKKGFRRARR